MQKLVLKLQKAFEEMTEFQNSVLNLNWATGTGSRKVLEIMPAEVIKKQTS